MLLSAHVPFTSDIRPLQQAACEFSRALPASAGSLQQLSVERWSNRGHIRGVTINCVSAYTTCLPSGVAYFTLGRVVIQRRSLGFLRYRVGVSRTTFATLSCHSLLTYHFLCREYGLECNTSQWLPTVVSHTRLQEEARALSGEVQSAVAQAWYAFDLLVCD